MASASSRVLVAAACLVAATYGAASCGGDVSGDGGGQAGASSIDASTDSDAKCPDGMKRCGMACVGVDDPAFGCAASSCAPCALAYATPACENGACAVACLAGHADCNGSRNDGCETDLDHDPANCGKCANACGPALCTGGACICNQSCKGMFMDCNGQCADGCEVDTGNDPKNCGYCGKLCGPGQTCDEGACQCAPGLGDCNGDASDGCEVNLLLDPNNCGACAQVCAIPGAPAACQAGICQVGCGCQAGWANCDGDCANGCEVNLFTDSKNCGACATVCVSGAACVAGHCCPSNGCGCPWPKADCNGIASDGCEANVADDPKNCGACGNTCPSVGGTPTCVSGICGIGCGCVQGYADCNGTCADGCETNTNTDPKNCGACGIVCAPGQICAAGACQ